MSREVPEWIGATDDTAIPPGVKGRIRERQQNVCIGCKRPFSTTLKPEFDHVIALKNWCNHVQGEQGGNRETNICAKCKACHREKTAKDRKEMAKVERIQHSVYGTGTPTRNPVPGSRNTPWKKKVNGKVERREK